MFLNIRYVPATEADTEAIMAVDDGLFDNPVKPDRLAEFLSDPRHELMLARTEDRIVGMASGVIHLHPDKDPVMFINEVGVLEELRGQGIGRELVKTLCHHARRLGCSEAWIATEEPNIAARKAFTAAGGLEDEDPVVLLTYELETNGEDSDGTQA